MSDDKKMIDYNIQKHSTLFLSGRILGGATKVEIREGTKLNQNMIGQTVLTYLKLIYYFMVFCT